MLEFVIPVTRNDLLSATISSYCVNDVVSSRHLAGKVRESQRILISEGQLGILQYFDVLFSVLHEWKSLEVAVKEETWHVALKGCETSVRVLVGVIKPLDANTTLNRDALLERRNAMKMHAYLLCQLIEMFENDANAEASSVAATKIGKGRGKSAAATARGRRQESAVSMDWPAECSSAITSLDQLCKLDIQQLWDPPVAEDDFINLLGNSCYKLLENKSMAANVTVRAAITGLLSTLILRYKHGMACCVKLAQMLQCFSHMSNVLPVIVNQFMETDSLIQFVKELFNEICSISGEDLERDSAGTHNFCSFLDSVASAHPSLAVSILPLIRNRLGEDPYQMRNCALNVIGEVLKNMYAGHPHLEGKDKIQRDRLMDVLEEHIHDVNGFVRARTLQIWHNIVTKGGLPVPRQSRLIRLLVGPEGAINDVSSHARKYALRLLTTIITQCPAVKLEINDLNDVLRKEEDRLHALEETLTVLNPSEMGLPENAEGGNDGAPHRKREYQGEGEEASSVEEMVLTKKRPRTSYSSASSSAGEGEEVGGGENDHPDTERGVSDAAAALQARIHDAVSVATAGEPPHEAGDPQAVGASSAAAAAATTSTSSNPEAMSAEVAFAVKQSQLQRQRACVAYLKEMQSFMGYVATAIEDVKIMLHAKTVTDVLEAIEFFLMARQAGVKNLDAALRHMMAMIWSNEETIRKAALDASRRLYFQPDIVNESITDDGRLSSAALTTIVSTLVRLVSESTLGDFVSLERILNELLDLDHVDRDLKGELWHRFVEKASAGGSSYERRQELKALLILLKMISSPSRVNLENHLSELVNYGLGAAMGYANVDLECAMFTCMVIQQMIPTEQKQQHQGKAKNASRAQAPASPSSRHPEPFRLPPSHQLCVSLRKLLVSTFTSASRVSWIPLMEQAVATIFQLIETPTLVMAEVIREIGEQLLKSALPPPASATKETAPLGNDMEEEAAEEEEKGPLEDQSPASCLTIATTFVPAFILTRFIALAGHVALKMLVHLEYAVLNEIKRRELVQEEVKQARRHAQKTPKTARKSHAIKGETSATDEDAGLLGAVADDAESDFIRGVLNNEVVTHPGHLLSRLLPLVVHACSNPSKFPDTDLQAAASLALVKFMLVSADVCEQNLQLLFTLAERSPSEVVRANLIVGLGDLARRFPNLIEPWTPNLYARLRDASPKVRINALNTLSHLILNDMIKVKGQISEMTVCLVDENDRLKQLSRLFFRELSQKGNALYNVMPDIISRLSDTEMGVDETKFRLTVDFLFPLIEKERLCETLVEKICSRFRVTQTERQSCDLAYCLRVMSFNERMIRTLQENLPVFAQHLSIPDVYTSLADILANAKKTAKPDILPQIEELESKIEEFHQKGVADEEVIQRADVMAKKAATKRRKVSGEGLVAGGSGGSAVARKSSRPRVTSPPTVEKNPPTSRKTRSRAGRNAATTTTRARRAPVFSSDEEEEDNTTEEEEDDD